MKHKHTILTGATGTLGLELLPRLIHDDPGQQVTLLLRGQSMAAMQRRFERVRRYAQAFWPGLDLASVQPVHGDLTAPQLGMPASTYRSLQRQVTRIIHAAALTKLDPPLELARRTNVGGTENVLKFAAGCVHLEQLAHVSTAFVAGDRQGIITENDLYCGQRFLNTYQQSKCEAERFVRSCMEILPIVVFRPGIIVGDSLDGHIAELDNIYLPLAHIAMGHLRQIPGRGAALLDMMPVDYIAAAMIRLLNTGECAGTTYHLTAGVGNAVMARHLVEAAIRHAGRDIHRKPVFTEDLASATRQAPGISERHPALKRLGVFFAHLNQRQEFDDANARCDLGAFAEGRPQPDRFLPRVFEFCRITQWGRRLDWACPQSRIGKEDDHEMASRVEMADSFLDAGRAGFCHAGSA